MVPLPVYHSFKLKSAFDIRKAVFFIHPNQPPRPTNKRSNMPLQSNRSLVCFTFFAKSPETFRIFAKLVSKTLEQMSNKKSEKIGKISTQDLNSTKQPAHCKFGLDNALRYIPVEACLVLCFCSVAV
jgi:hypothetical protein